MTLKSIILWLAFIIAGLLPASALTSFAPENCVWEIFSIGYDAAITEATNLGNRTQTPTSDYDTAPIHRAPTETIPTAVERPLFGPNAEFKAAEGITPTSEGLINISQHLSTVDARNALKVQYRALSPPDAVLQFEQRNIELYGNPVGPSAAQLNAAGKTWEQIIESAARPGGSDLGF